MGRWGSATTSGHRRPPGGSRSAGGARRASVRRTSAAPRAGSSAPGLARPCARSLVWLDRLRATRRLERDGQLFGFLRRLLAAPLLAAGVGLLGRLRLARRLEAGLERSHQINRLRQRRLGRRDHLLAVALGLDHVEQRRAVLVVILL